MTSTKTTMTEAMEAARERFNDVFDHPEARGRFKEGMSIAQNIYRGKLDNAIAEIDEPATRLYSVTVNYETERGSQMVRTYVVLSTSEQDAVDAALEASTGSMDTDISTEVHPFLGELATRVVADLQDKSGKLAWRPL